MGYEALKNDKIEFLRKCWAGYAPQVQKEWGIDLSDGLELRHKAQTDLFWLCNILGRTKLRGKREWNGYQIDTHQEMCDFFVHKDPLFKTFEEFAKQDKETHNRLLLVPRGGYKSTINIADCVQWTICFPDIAILSLTGVRKLAVDFVGEYTTYFTLSEDGTPRYVRIDGEDRISLFQILFPEHCIRPQDAKQDEFTTPARRVNSKEPTIMAAGIEQSLSGWHFDILKPDDVVTNDNSYTQHKIQWVNRQLGIDHAMLHPYGYYDKVGTWYDIADTYGQDIKAEEELKKEGRDPSIKILLRSALWLKPEAIARGVNDDNAREEDYILWFPEGLSYEFLMDQRRKNQETYAIKYLNNPLAAHQIKFPRELLIARTVDTIPQSGIVFEAWDLAYSEKESAKYTVGMAGLFSSDGIYLIDMVRGRFGEYELPGVMAAFAHKWKPRRVAVEDSMGARWLKRGIDEELAKTRTNVAFEFISLGKGSKAKSKEIKAKGASNMLGTGRLFFWKSMTGLQDAYNEMEAFPKGTFTDIVCSLSLLVNHFSNFTYAVMPTEPIFITERMERVQRDMVYGLGAYAPKVQDQTMIALQGEQDVDYDPLAQSGLY
jgi:phage terminase large subunit-like protein